MFVIALTLRKHSGIKVPHSKESEGIYLEKSHQIVYQRILIRNPHLHL